MTNPAGNRYAIALGLEAATTASGYIRGARVRAELTQDQAAAAIGVGRYAIAGWEAGRTLPRVRYVLRMAEAYGVELVELAAVLDETASRRRHPSNGSA